MFIWPLTPVGVCTKLKILQKGSFGSNSIIQKGSNALSLIYFIQCSFGNNILGYFDQIVSAETGKNTLRASKKLWQLT